MDDAHKRRCAHGVALGGFPPCAQCMIEMPMTPEHKEAYRRALQKDGKRKADTEREELVLKFMMAFVSRPMYYAALDDYVEGAVEFADAYIKWRDEERRK